MKYYLLLIVSYLCGMLSVSISNVFGGNYSPVVVVLFILFTVVTIDTLNIKELEKRKNDLILLTCLCGVELVFFLINDVISYPVYVKGDTGVIGFIVMFSQFYSILLIAYYGIKMCLNGFKKTNVEIIEKVDANEEKIEKSEEPVEEESAETDFVESIKEIPVINHKKKSFMEDESN